MEFTYGKGTFRQENVVIEGEVILSEHKLFLKGDAGDYASTYVPLEKIQRIRLQGDVLSVYVYPTMSFQYVASFTGSSKRIAELARDIANFRGFKKKFLRNEWVEVNR